MNKKNLTHIVGTFLIEADGAFLNGAGLGGGEDRNVTVPKTFRNGKEKIPYVSAQSWRRWLRNTLLEETGWPKSELRATKTNTDGATSKIAGELNPIEYPEDDIFGYMSTREKQEGQSSVKSLMRTSPFSSSILTSIRKNGWQGRDEGFVHLKEGSPLPYTTEFYNTHLQGIFSLNYNRLGLFYNIGDRIELDDNMIGSYLESGKIKAIDKREDGIIYGLSNLNEIKKKRTKELFKALGVLRGGAKQAAFGTDVSPKFIILAGLSSGNPIFNHLFDDKGLGPELNLEKLKEILSDYSDRIMTPVLIGMRKGYIVNENEIKQLEKLNTINNKHVEIMVLSPIEATTKIGDYLE